MIRRYRYQGILLFPNKYFRENFATVAEELNLQLNDLLDVKSHLNF